MATKEIAGKMLELDADGNLAKRTDWNEEIAKALAVEEGIPELNDRRWLVINYTRKNSKPKGDAPSIRKLTKESGVDKKRIVCTLSGWTG